MLHLSSTTTSATFMSHLYSALSSSGPTGSRLTDLTERRANSFPKPDSSRLCTTSPSRVHVRVGFKELAYGTSHFSLVDSPDTSCLSPLHCGIPVTHQPSRRCAGAALAMALCLSVCLSVRQSQAGVLSKRLNRSVWILVQMLPFAFLHCVVQEFGCLQK